MDEAVVFAFADFNGARFTAFSAGSDVERDDRFLALIGLPLRYISFAPSLCLPFSRRPVNYNEKTIFWVLVTEVLLRY